MSERATKVRRVKISDELLAELRRDWSAPVQVRVEGTLDQDGDLELVFRTVDALTLDIWDRAQPVPDSEERE